METVKPSAFGFMYLPGCNLAYYPLGILGPGVRLTEEQAAYLQVRLGPRFSLAAVGVFALAMFVNWLALPMAAVFIAVYPYFVAKRLGIDEPVPRLSWWQWTTYVASRWKAPGSFLAMLVSLFGFAVDTHMLHGAAPAGIFGVLFMLGFGFVGLTSEAAFCKAVVELRRNRLTSPRGRSLTL